MSIIISLVIYLLFFSGWYWSTFYLINLFVSVNKLEFLVYYLIIGFFLELLTNVLLREDPLLKKWDSKMHILGLGIKPQKFYISALSRVIAWPVGFFLELYLIIKNKSYRTKISYFHLFSHFFLIPGLFFILISDFSIFTKIIMIIVFFYFVKKNAFWQLL